MQLLLFAVVAGALSIAVAAPATGARVHKCVDGAGRVTYTDQGCRRAEREVVAPLPELGHFPAPDRAASQPAPPPDRSAPRPPSPPRMRGAGAGRIANSRPTPNPAAVAARRFLSAGMTDAEVLARAGKPDRVDAAAGSARLRGAAARRGRGARWIYLPATGDSDTITIVEIESGVVAEVERRLVR